MVHYINITSFYIIVTSILHQRYIQSTQNSPVLKHRISQRDVKKLGPQIARKAHFPVALEKDRTTGETHIPESLGIDKSPLIALLPASLSV